MKSGGHNGWPAPCSAHVGVFVYVVPWAPGGFCKYGKWKTNGFSALIVQCHLASHLSLPLLLSLSALRRIVRDAVWLARSLRCDIEYTVKASRPTH